MIFLKMITCINLLIQGMMMKTEEGRQRLVTQMLLREMPRSTSTP